MRFAHPWLDATYVKCRVDGRSVSQAVVTAIGLDDTGHKRFLGVDCADTEPHAGWKAFLSDLRARGVAAGEDGAQLVVSDAHEGLESAIAETFQWAAWQRCVTHLMRNVVGHVHRREDQRIAREAMKAAFAQKNPLVARAHCQRAAEEVAKPSPSAGGVLLEAEEALAYPAFPVSHRTKIRTDNVQERADREIKRRTNVVQGFPSRESLIRLAGAVLIEADEERSVSCVISKPSPAHAWRRAEGSTPSEESMLAARQAAVEIISAAIDPEGEQGQHSSSRGGRRFQRWPLMHHKSGRGLLFSWYDMDVIDSNL